MGLADFFRIIYSVGFIIWIFPPIRQFRTPLFYFFLILAIGDTFSLGYSFLLSKSIPLGYFVAISFLLIISLTDKVVLMRHKYLILAIWVMLVIGLFNVRLETSYYFILVALLHSIIFIMILKLFIMSYVNYSKINFFLLMLLFYQTTILFKVLNMAIGFADAAAFFIITSIAQIIFGLYFSIVRADRSEFITKL
jgi:hypothetical protein